MTDADRTAPHCYAGNVARPLPGILHASTDSRHPISQEGKQEGPVIANIAEDRKCNNYHQLETSHYFEPVAIETLGGIGETSYNFLKELSRSIDAETQEKRSFLFFRQWLGVAVQRGNAICVLEPALFLHMS